MKICALSDNAAENGCKAEHGLSLYIETQEKNILFDTGQSSVFADNAEKMGIDLSKADFAVISHGHYDHTGGLKHFLKINPSAPVYIQKNAFMPFYNKKGKNIGTDKDLQNNPRIVLTEDFFQITPKIYTETQNREKQIFRPKEQFLYRGTPQTEDSFLHEQYLIIMENGKKFVFSGCSHKGILNIASWYKPDFLIGGFHLKDYGIEQDADSLKEIAENLKKSRTVFYTGHCTGTEQFRFLKQILKDRLEYLSAGTIIALP